MGFVVLHGLSDDCMPTRVQAVLANKPDHKLDNGPSGLGRIWGTPAEERIGRERIGGDC